MSLIREHMPDRYRRVARTVGLCLFNGPNFDNWHGLSVVLTSRLELEERAFLGWSVLRSMTPEQAVDVLNTALPQRAGQPIAAFESPVDEAAYWADLASQEELEAYCLVCFNRMPPHRQSAFLDFATRRAAA